MKRTIILTLFFALFGFTSFAQKERKFVRSGNDFYLDALKDTTKVDSIAFANAETKYQKALELTPDNKKWKFNLGDAKFKQGDYEGAAEIFSELGEQFTEKEDKAKAYHNLGNSYLAQKQLDESIEAYKNALRNNPSDMETKYNLAFAQKAKKEKEKQDQQQNQDQNKDQNKDQDKKDQDKKDQDKKDQDKKDQNKDQDKKDQDKKDQNKKDQKDRQQQPQQRPGQISKKDAEAMLKALENNEKKTQEKVKKAKAAKAKARNIEKDW